MQWDTYFSRFLQKKITKISGDKDDDNHCWLLVSFLLIMWIISKIVKGLWWNCRNTSLTAVGVGTCLNLWQKISYHGNKKKPNFDNVFLLQFIFFPSPSYLRHWYNIVKKPHILQILNIISLKVVIVDKQEKICLRSHCICPKFSSILLPARIRSHYELLCWLIKLACNQHQ
jgi:hypothetical protein